MMKTMYICYMVFIYALIDPFTFKVRYIGKTDNLKRRLANQLNEKSKTHRCNWISSLIKQGRKPIQVVLQEVDKDNWIEAEKKWIRIAKKYNWPLVNSTDGGDGVLNLSGEGKQKIIETWKGRKHKPESIEKMRAANTGKVKEEKSKDLLSQKMKGRKIEWKDKLQLSVRKFDDELLNAVENDLKKMKVIDVANKYGVHRTTISKIKSGKYKTFKQKTVNYRKPRRYDELQQPNTTT